MLLVGNTHLPAFTALDRKLLPPEEGHDALPADISSLLVVKLICVAVDGIRRRQAIGPTLAMGGVRDSKNMGTAGQGGGDG